VAVDSLEMVLIGGGMEMVGIADSAKAPAGREKRMARRVKM